MTRFQFFLTRQASRLWVRPTVMSLAAVAWIAVAYGTSETLRDFAGVDIEKDTLVNLFSILASTMLTVATFSVSAVATAFGAVATNCTPRATKVVMSDRSVQSTLGAFLAAFIYAVVAITALSALNFRPSGRFMLFAGFVLLVGWVLFSFLNWVDRVSRLGKLTDTVEQVTAVARQAFANPDIAGPMGARSHASAERPPDGHVLRCDRFGYVQHLDMESLQAIAEDAGGELWLDVRPGSWVTRGAPIGLLRAASPPTDEQRTAVLAAVSTGGDRSAETDPRFGMILLAEIADRALSPAVNDPGTAISVLGVQVEMFHVWAETDRQHGHPDEPRFDRLYVPALTAADLVLDAFTPIARDGAGMVEVCVRLQKSLCALMHVPHPALREAAANYRETALEMAERALPVESQKKMVRDLARKPA